ncbi:ferritin-like domain-containing protein [Tenacibaculum sp. IB213877]|jgi:ferritin-like metal-binding protein YciE|uniref:YciE/YciF ferroxidase family protein n=1 Tax=Tenacibaculum sp. IB213877 TaxID=3097351 RepID=UPI002A5AA2E7|nr:ferritin-like domain-containing protein [Tenacibaculum sp. IB213877]MDY0781104.1 ferritin-like domain-containing protein [Tenacibaculum sp. IB213877]
MRTLQDLFEHEIKDLYSAEKQMLEALPKMVKATSDKKLQKAFSDHLEETKKQFDAVHSICDELDINPTSTKCKAMEGLIKECDGMIKEDAVADVKDAGLIACAQRIEHYEISGYGTAVRFAKELGHNTIARKLQDILNQEYNADNLLDKIAENRVNEKAMS